MQHSAPQVDANKHAKLATKLQKTGSADYPPPAGAPPGYSAPPSNATGAHPLLAEHTNSVIEASHLRARDEQQMQTLLQNLQYEYQIYNPEIEPEHETEYPCNCPIHQYQRRKWSRYRVQDKWSDAVKYPGEKSYNDNPYAMFGGFTNPYRMRVVSPYGWQQNWYGPKRPIAGYHATCIHQTINLNNSLNKKAQDAIDAKEPSTSIWDDESLTVQMRQLGVNDLKDTGRSSKGVSDLEKVDEKTGTTSTAPTNTSTSEKQSRFSRFRQSISLKPSDGAQSGPSNKAIKKSGELRDAILREEQGRWPDQQWKYIVEMYLEKSGMSKKVADLRARHPIQYLHLLRAGYFEPIPVAWADQASNPLKFSIEASAGWRGITPAWRGYEDTAEERLYWVLNHRESSSGNRLKPDFISALQMARARMATAVEPPPQYFATDDVCHVQHTSAGYSKQVMPPAFKPYDRPEQATDDTMILLDVSGSMDFTAVRPIYDQYLVTGYERSGQPKNKDVAKAIIRRFTDAMVNHDHQFKGYDLTTFANHGQYIGTINHQNLDRMWRNVKLGGGTRVMTGWQKVKQLHFEKHSESVTYHPVYGWQAGPSTPMLRLLLLLDGEATDMDEFELDLLGLSWAHVTIFLIGVEGCPHHHRHANELQRISDVNHHVSFVDAQGNTPERFVTHELLKRHLGYEVSMREFEELEVPPPYTEEQ